MRFQKLLFLIIGVIVAIVCSEKNMPNLLTIICSFLPVTISMVFDDIEKINLAIAKIALMNKTVAIKVAVKNIFIASLEDKDPNIYEQQLKEKLIHHGVKVGKENKILRVEGSQQVSFGKDKNIKIKVPVLIYLQLQDNQIICTLRNSSNSIAYRDIRNIIRNLEFTWDFINENVCETCGCKQQSAFYEARICLDSDKFKNVYLKSYSQKIIHDVQVKRKNVNIEFNEKEIIISSDSEQQFEREIKRYSGLFGNFFKDEG